MWPSTTCRRPQHTPWIHRFESHAELGVALGGWLANSLGRCQARLTGVSHTSAGGENAAHHLLHGHHLLKERADHRMM